jgi:hypothetical protein
VVSIANAAPWEMKKPGDRAFKKLKVGDSVNLKAKLRVASMEASPDMFNFTLEIIQAGTLSAGK